MISRASSGRLQGFVNGLPRQTGLLSNPSRTDARRVRVTDALAQLRGGGVTLILGDPATLGGTVERFECFALVHDGSRVASATSSANIDG
jgi:hypothetical protein